MSKHTEGPWNVCEPVGWMPQGRYWTAEQMMEMWWVGKRPGVAVALIDGSVDGRVEAEANARLIASAPDLLSACEGAYLALLQSLPATRVRMQGELAALRDAIADATGQDREDVQRAFEVKAARGHCARCNQPLDNVSPGYSVVAGGATVCANCLRPGEEVARARSI